MGPRACGCANPVCRQFGCQIAAREMAQQMPFQPGHVGQYPTPQIGHGTPLAGHGCICPPGAEATCKGPLCPRRPIGDPS
jgi:hypothetical protein